MFQSLAAEERFNGWPILSPGESIFDIPFYGKVMKEIRRDPDGSPHSWYPILRWFGWAVVFGVTKDGFVLTLCQWKNGVDCATWELPPGGVREFKPGMNEEEMLSLVQAGYLKETGFGGGVWKKLGHVIIESGKYRGEKLDDHGLRAHLYLATDLAPIAEARKPNANEIMETIIVPLDEWSDVLASGLFVETSAVPCAYAALLKLGRLKFM